MPAITQKEIEAAYALGRLVVAQQLAESAAVSTLVNDHGMDRGSASGYVRQVGHFLAGKLYTRTINDAATRYYLERIAIDYGAAALAKALDALAAHIDYYEKVAQAKRPALRLLLAEFQEAADRSFEREMASFDEAVALSRKLPAAERNKLLPPPGTRPASKTVTTRIFMRSQHVVAAALVRANGVCEQCKYPAPFAKKTDGTPYLEVHHVTTLAKGGEDTLENVLALCPNCHRQHHFG